MITAVIATAAPQYSRKLQLLCLSGRFASMSLSARNVASFQPSKGCVQRGLGLLPPGQLHLQAMAQSRPGLGATVSQGSRNILQKTIHSETSLVTALSTEVEITHAWLQPYDLS